MLFQGMQKQNEANAVGKNGYRSNIVGFEW